MSVSLSALAGPLFDRPPDPELARLILRRLRSARDSAVEVAGQLRGPVLGWQGPAADALVLDANALADTVTGWVNRLERFIGAVTFVVADLDAELSRRSQVRSAVLESLGRLATLPADAHRDLDRAFSWLGSSGGWDAALTSLRSFLL